MGNMAYCRFHNTLQDLRDCYEHIDDMELSESEARERERLIALCKEIADDFANEED